MADLTARYVGKGLRSNLRAVAFWGMATFIATLDAASRWLEQTEIELAQRAGNLCINAYLTLANMALESGQCLYVIRPKVHYMVHHVDDLSNSWNPRFWMTFQDEDMMGKLARLGRKCHRVTMPLRFLQRYALFMARRWARREKQQRFS